MAAILMLRDEQKAKYYVSKLEHKYNKGKVLGIFTHKLGRAIYFMLKNKEAFEHFEPNFDTVSASAVVFQQPAKQILEK